MDIKKEASDFALYVNKTVTRGFSARVLADNAVRVEFSDSENSFDLVLVADSSYNVFVLDVCPVSMNNRPAMFKVRPQLGYFMLKLAEYNIKMNKRLS
jgi:hypothetical protein